MRHYNEQLSFSTCVTQTLPFGQSIRALRIHTSSPLHSSGGRNDHRLEPLDAGAIHMGHSQNVQDSIVAIVILGVGVEVVGIVEPAKVPVHVVVERLHASCVRLG